MLGYLQLEPQQLHVYMYCWRLRGGGSVEPVEPAPPRYGPDSEDRLTHNIAEAILNSLLKCKYR